MGKFILFLILLATLFASPVEAASPRAHERASPNARFQREPCVTETLAAAISGANIDVTVPAGTTADHSVTYLNRTDGQQWVKASVEYMEGQPELRLPASWVQFEPETVCLEAGAYQVINITISIPKKAESGTYFALLIFAVCLEDTPMCAAVGIKATVSVE